MIGGRCACCVYNKELCWIALHDRDEVIGPPHGAERNLAFVHHLLRGFPAAFAARVSLQLVASDGRVCAVCLGWIFGRRYGWVGGCA